ncbi:heavy-metal-associated domain-containing protein [Halorubrum amylolyticum]|jgi:copper chaperone CopZ|uniref:heavy-metal-associated domain-containing protein n=1 Tax=Halorubrum amylolyticum TaxID=2508724 RepID=UPI00100894C7|nr:heavy-metal-associated domain-containing protein [Halorubrum amylolyticum]
MVSTTQIRVTDSVFACENCANTIERVLLKKGGVEDVTVDGSEKELEVRFHRSRMDEDRIVELVEEWGYTPEGSSP